MRLQALQYTGGKGASQGGHPTGRWVAAQLPTDTYAYIEAFAGMCGVLLQRHPVPCEIINDLDGRITAWWRVVRDRPDDLSALLEATPFSRPEYELANSRLDEAEDDLEVAWCVSVLLGQGHMPMLPGRSWRTPSLSYVTGSL